MCKECGSKKGLKIAVKGYPFMCLNYYKSKDENSLKNSPAKQGNVRKGLLFTEV